MSNSVFVRLDRADHIERITSRDVPVGAIPLKELTVIAGIASGDTTDIFAMRQWGEEILRQRRNYRESRKPGIQCEDLWGLRINE